MKSSEFTCQVQHAQIWEKLHVSRVYTVGYRKQLVTRDKFVAGRNIKIRPTISGSVKNL